MAFVAANLYNSGRNSWIGIKSTSTQDKNYHWVTSPERLAYDFWDSQSPRPTAGNDGLRKCVAAHWQNGQNKGLGSYCIYFNEFLDFPYKKIAKNRLF